MNEILAKKYVKAILDRRRGSEEFYENLVLLCSAFSLPKCKEIVNSYELSREQKFEFVKGLVQNPSKNFFNFLRILSQNQRLGLIPLILAELSRQRALQKQIYTGRIYSNEALSKVEIEQLEQGLSAKFGLSIKLENELSSNEGLKISLEELGYEIAFSMPKLKNKIFEFVFKNV